MTQELMIVRKGTRNFKLKYSIVFEQEKAGTHGIGEIIVTEMHHECDAKHTFGMYLEHLFAEDPLDLVIHSCKEVFDICG